MSLSTKVVTDVTEYSSGDGVTVDNAENKISADYDAIAARLNGLPDPLPLSSQVYGVLSGLAGVPKVAQMTRTEYEELEVKDPATLYIITADI